MKEKYIKYLVLLGYCIPYIFIAMYGDAKMGSIGFIIFYGFMFLGMGSLLYLSLKIKNIWVIILGNILSTTASYICIVNFLTQEEYGYYFKPFLIVHLAIIISVIAFFIQLIIYINKK